MKRLKNTIKAAIRKTALGSTFTADEVVDFLSHIKELEECNVTLLKSTDNYCQIRIGDSVYHITNIG